MDLMSDAKSEQALVGSLPDLAETSRAPLKEEAEPMFPEESFEPSPPAARVQPQSAGGNGNGNGNRAQRPDNPEHFAHQAPNELSSGDVGDLRDNEAERSILGALLVEPGSVNLVKDKLRAQDFSKPSHGTIYSAILAIAERGILPDLISLAEELRARGVLDQCGGAAYVSTLTSASFTSANIEYYAGIVHDLALRRKARALSEDLKRGVLELSDFIGQVAALKDGQGKKREIRVLNVAEIFRISAGRIRDRALPSRGCRCRGDRLHWHGEKCARFSICNLGYERSSLSWEVRRSPERSGPLLR